MNGGANRDGPDLSWKDWVTVPRQGAVKARRETRKLSKELRAGLTLKNASGMTSTRWRAATHSATGRLHSRFAVNARLSAAASVGCPEQGPRRRSAVCRKRLVLEKTRRVQGSLAYRPPSRFPWEAILGERAGGPNAAQPGTQTVSTPYLRLEIPDGKLVAEKTHKPQAWGAPLSSD